MNMERLAEPLDAGRVKQRTNGRGGQLSYLETHDAIRAANEIFGFGRWGHEVVDLRQIPGVTVHNSDGKVGTAVGYVCIVRLRVDGCIPTSGVGYGDATEYRESAAVTAHELAAKEAESDALKRALKNFGDQFGLALYDKDAARSGHVTSGAAEKPAAQAQRAQESRQQANGDAADFRFASGKHQGKTLAEVPRGYVEWCAAEHPKPEVRAAATAFLGELVPAGGFVEDPDVPFMPTEAA